MTYDLDKKILDAVAGVSENQLESANLSVQVSKSILSLTELINKLEKRVSILENAIIGNSDGL